MQQLRYTESEIDQIKVLFPDTDSLKLYRKYLLNLPVTDEEKVRIKAAWGQQSVRALLYKTTLPFIDGNEAIGVGYDFLNNISTSEHDAEFNARRIQQFVAAAQYFDQRLKGLDDVDAACTGTGAWLTASVLTGPAVTPDEILQQLITKQNVEGVLVGLNAIINAPVETAEQQAAREAADSSN